MQGSRRAALVMLTGIVLGAFAASEARAGLVYEKINGVDLIYDNVTQVTWTRDANLSGQTFDYSGAQTWASSLAIPGLNGIQWRLPDEAEFTSLFTNLYPFGAPGSPGADHKYGTQVFFGAGTNDYAANVQTYYWTPVSGVSFNFFYGYPSQANDTDLLPVWAVTSDTIVSAVPEPSQITLAISAIVTLGFGSLRRRMNARGN